MSEPVPSGRSTDGPFDAVAEGVGVLLGVDVARLMRLEPDGTLGVVATWSADLGAAPGHLPVRASAGGRILVEGRVWGALVVSCASAASLPAGTGSRLAAVTALVGTAVANVQVRSRLRALAEEQAALRRIAELVARGVPPEEVLRAVVVEASDLLGDAGMSLLRFRPDGDAVVVATHRERTPEGLVVPAEGAPWARERLRTSGAVRVRGFEGTPAEQLAREYAVAAVVVVPIMVDGQVWGMLSTSASGGRFPAGTEERLGQFASLAGTAVANADSRAQLTASRARVVAAADATRRQLQRDVHDGAQQRLVQTIVTLRLARQALDGDPGPAAPLIEEALLHAERATAELRDLVRGILPAPLTRGGLRAGVESLCADLPLAVDVQVSAPRLPVATETTAYFVIAEALANVVKHANATSARVTAAVEAGRLQLEIRDDGAGGADPGRGSGLTGLLDRVQAREGTVMIESPPGEGTVVRAMLPVGSG